MLTSLTVNGRAHPLEHDVRVTLLDALRERLGLTGTKKGCDHRQCGACTVLIDGQRVLSCFVLAATVKGEVTTIEGLSGEGRAGGRRRDADAREGRRLMRSFELSIAKDAHDALRLGAIDALTAEAHIRAPVQYLAGGT